MMSTTWFEVGQRHLVAPEAQWAGHPGTVDDGVHLPEALQRRGERFGHGPGVRHVRGIRPRPATVADSRRRRPLSRCLVAIEAGDRQATSGQQQGGGLTDPGPGSDDDGALGRHAVLHSWTAATRRSVPVRS